MMKLLLRAACAFGIEKRGICWAQDGLANTGVRICCGGHRSFAGEGAKPFVGKLEKDMKKTSPGWK
jgi:hypothetical protein